MLPKIVLITANIPINRCPSPVLGHPPFLVVILNFQLWDRQTDRIITVTNITSHCNCKLDFKSLSQKALLKLLFAALKQFYNDPGLNLSRIVPTPIYDP